MTRLQVAKTFLNELKKAPPKSRRLVIKEATPSQIASVCEVCLNVLSNNVPLSRQRKHKLVRHKKLIRYLANKRVSLKKKKNQLLKDQSGGFLPILASLIPGIIGGLTGALS